MQLSQQVSLIGHRVQISVQAIDDHDASVFFLDVIAQQMGEFTGGELGGVDLTDGKTILPNGLSKIDTDSGGTGNGPTVRP